MYHFATRNIESHYYEQFLASKRDLIISVGGYGNLSKKLEVNASFQRKPSRNNTKKQEKYFIIVKKSVVNQLIPLNFKFNLL